MVFSRARGTAISTGPKVPVNDRVRLPWRWPVTPAPRFGIGLPAARVARSGQGGLELTADQFFDEPARPIAHFSLDRIKPIVEKLGAVSASRCWESVFVIVLVMAWSPVRRSNAG